MENIKDLLTAPEDDNSENADKSKLNADQRAEYHCSYKSVVGKQNIYVSRSILNQNPHRTY